MKIIKGYPPNIELIKITLGIYPNALYCYGDTVYTPEGHDIPLDIQLHEKVHIEQQAKELNPDLWWSKYLKDRDFRQEMEVEAYAVQYAYVKGKIPVQGSAQCLFELANNLKSPQYKLGLSYGKAESLIRNRAKSII